MNKVHYCQIFSTFIAIFGKKKIITHPSAMEGISHVDPSPVIQAGWITALKTGSERKLSFK